MPQLFTKNESGVITSLVCDSSGAVIVDGTAQPSVRYPLLCEPIDLSSSGVHEIIPAPGASNRLRICQFSVSSGEDPAVRFFLEIRSGPTVLNSIMTESVIYDYIDPLNLGINEGLFINVNTNTRIVGGVNYYIESVSL